MRLERSPFVLVHGWELWFALFPFLFDVLRFGSAQGDAQLQGVVPMRTVLESREPVSARTHLRSGSVGESRADEPVVYGRPRAVCPPAVGGLIVADAQKAVFRAERIQPRVVFVLAARVLACFVGGRRLGLQVTTDGNLVAGVIRRVDRCLEMCPDLFEYGRLADSRCAALGGDVCVHDDQVRPVR